MPKAWPVYCMCMACCWPLANSLSSADAATYLGFRPNSHRNRTSNLTPISCEKNKKLSLPVANWSLISLNIWYGNVLLGFFFFFIWFVRLLALRPLLAYCASLGW
jgi:hypothetical protein